MNEKIKKNIKFEQKPQSKIQQFQSPDSQQQNIKIIFYFFRNQFYNNFIAHFIYIAQFETESLDSHLFCCQIYHINLLSYRINSMEIENRRTYDSQFLLILQNQTVHGPFSRSNIIGFIYDFGSLNLLFYWSKIPLIDFNFNIQITYTIQLQYLLRNQQMTKKLTLIVCLVLFNIVLTFEPLNSCPTGVAPLDLYSDSFVISTSSTSSIHLVSGEDVNCYNYTLPSPFLEEPTVAIAINHFEAQKTPDLFFSIKPVWSYQYIQIPFQVRTQWKYSNWVKLIVNFLLETRKDIETGFYQRDTGLVGSCGTFKSQPVFLPFVNKWNVSKDSPLSVRLFLNGFEISSQQGSPYQIKLSGFSYNNSGINAKIIVNSTTIVNSVYISYVAFKTNNFGLKNINGFIEKISSQSSFSQPILQNGFQNFKYFLYGVSGFQFCQQNNVFLDINIGSNFLANFNFSGQKYDYIGFQYIIFEYAACQRCVNYPFNFNNQCVKKCPESTLTISNTCYPCPTNSFADNGRCICKQGYYNISGDCTTCPIGQIFTGGVCTGCGKNALWVGSLCQCSSGYYNISGVCTPCPANTHWNGYSCVGCGINSYYFAGSCQCSPGYYNISGVCNKCPTGTIFNGNSCVIPCKPGEIWTGTRCISLCSKVDNSFWNGIQCICNQGFFNITGRCSKCPDGQTWNGSNCGDQDDNNIYISFSKKSNKEVLSKQSN